MLHLIAKQKDFLFCVNTVTAIVRQGKDALNFYTSKSTLSLGMESGINQLPLSFTKHNRIFVPRNFL